MGNRAVYYGDCKSPYSAPADCKSAGTGAVASFVASTTGIMTDKLPEAWQVTCMVAAGGLSGGVTASMAGGYFWNGVCNGLVCSGLNHEMHLACETLEGPDDPPGSKKNNTVEETQNEINKTGVGLTLIGGAAKIANEATIGKSALLGISSGVGEALTGLAILVNARINYVKYRSGEIDFYSMCARDGMTIVEAAIAKIPFGLGVVPSVTLTSYDIEGGFEQTLYNRAWVKAQVINLDQHLNQYKVDPRYQPIYYHHGK